MGESFWQNNSLVTHILFELQPIIIFSPVANFGNQSIFSIILVASEHQNRFRIIKFRENKIDGTPILKHAMVKRSQSNPKVPMARNCQPKIPPCTVLF